MTREEAIEILEERWRYSKTYKYTDAEIREAFDMAIKALEQESITWILGKDNAQVAVRNMPINKMQKICAIIGDDEKLTVENCLDDAREDFMYDVYNTLDFLPTNDEANRIIDSFDRVTSGIWQEPCEDCHFLATLPSVQPKTNVLDKLRAEIEEERKGYPPSAGYYKAIVKVLQILDKCKAESEDKE